MRLSVLSLTVLLLTVGCVPYWHGKEMRADIAAAQVQLEQLTEDQRAQRQALKTSTDSLTKRLQKLEATLSKDIEKLQVNSADGGSAMDDLRREMAMLRGEIATFKHKQKEEQKADGLPQFDAVAGAPALPKKAADLYRYGYERKMANDCANAIRAFVKLARTFPKHSRADNSLALTAECQYLKKDYTASLRTLKIIVDKYPKGDKADDALVLMHDNFMALGQCKQALVFLEAMVSDHPSSNRIKEARRKLRKTRRACKK